MRVKSAVARLTQVPLAFYNDRSYSHTPSPERHVTFSQSFDTLVANTIAHYHVPGIAIAVINGSDTFSKGYGYAQFSPSIPVTSSTLFFTGSTTKAFTAAALSLLVDDNTNYPRVQWTTPIHTLIPADFALADDYSTLHITLADAASHRTGLPRHDFSWLAAGPNATTTSIIHSMRHLPLTQPLRTTFQYCNLMFATLGHIVSTLTDQWLGDFLSEQIWKPLNMTSTYFSLQDALSSNATFARGQYWLNGSQSYMPVDYVNLTAIEGAGAVISNVDDYAKWIRMMMNRDLPISPAQHEELVTPHTIINRSPLLGSDVSYGYGWITYQYKGHDVVWHNGGINGFGANALYIPSKQWGCIMMANTKETSNIVEEILTFHLIDELLSVPLGDRVPWAALYDNALASQVKFRNTTLARNVIYSPSETGNLSHSLPLAAYAGSYSHPAYGIWSIQYNRHNNTLTNNRDSGPQLQYNATLEHISGDNFLVIAYSWETPDDPMYITAEFQVGVSGKVERMGLELEEEMEGGRIWFKRVDQMVLRV